MAHPRAREKCTAPDVATRRTEDLLARFRDGDQEAFEQIVGDYADRLVQFFYRLCWDRDRAEDFTQELFMKLLRGARTYRPRGRLGTFIFRIATNLWIDHYRSTRPQPRLYSLDQPIREGEEGFAASAPAETPSPADTAIEREDRDRLRAALESLNEPHRLVFELAIYQQLSYGTISRVLDIPIGTVKSRMHNTVRALRERLARREGGGAGRAAGGAG